MSIVRYIAFGNALYGIEPFLDDNSLFYLVNVFTRQYVGISKNVLVNIAGTKSRKLFTLTEVNDDDVIIQHEQKTSKFSVAYSKGKGYFLSLTESVTLKSIRSDCFSNELMMFIFSNLKILSDQLCSVKNILEYNFPISNVPCVTGNLREYQKESAAFLEEFDELCTKLDIKFWLCAGTLLGAVRHKGFIPWDDDLDVNMMADDFEKLKNYMIEQNRFVSTKKELKKIDGFALVDFYPIVYRLRKMNQGTFSPAIDIFVNYNIPSHRTVREQYKLLREINRNSRIVLRNEGLDSFREYINSELKKISQLEMSDYIFRGSQQGRIRKSKFGFFKKFVFSTHDIFPLVKLEFENHKYYVPNNYVKYLTDAYGDYVSYPEAAGFRLRHKFAEVSLV